MVVASISGTHCCVLFVMYVSQLESCAIHVTLGWADLTDSIWSDVEGKLPHSTLPCCWKQAEHITLIPARALDSSLNI